MREVLSRKPGTDVQTPVRFGNFDIVNDVDDKPMALGKGTFGRTYKACHRFLDTVAGSWSLPGTRMKRGGISSSSRARKIRLASAFPDRTHLRDAGELRQVCLGMGAAVSSLAVCPTRRTALAAEANRGG